MVIEQRFHEEKHKQRHISMKGSTLQALHTSKNFFLGRKG